jgi:hypothetical protein
MVVERISAARVRLSYASGIVVVGCAFVILAARLFRLADRYAVNIFFGDQWAFHSSDLFEKHSLWQMFRWQYGPHRLGLGPLLSELIEPSFRWNSRVESFVVCSVVVLAAGCALLLKNRLFGSISILDIAIPIVYLTATQYESLFINSDLAHGPLPLVLLTLYCLGWTVGDVLVRYILVLALNFVIIYTGFGLFLGFLTPPLLVSDFCVNLRGKTKARFYFAGAFLISCASVASFFYDYKFQPAVTCFSLKPRMPLQYFWYVALMFANLWVKGVGLLPKLIGSLVVLSLVWTMLVAVIKLVRSDSRSWMKHAASATLVGYALLFSVTAAIGRICLGLGSAQSSRYMNYVTLGVFGVYLHLFSLESPRLRRVLLGVAIVALLATVPIQSEDRGLMKSFSEIKGNWRSCYLGGGSISECDTRAGSKIFPQPQPVLERKLHLLRQSRNNLYADLDK